MVKAIQGLSYATRGRYVYPPRFANYVCDEPSLEVSSVAEVVSYLRERKYRLNEIAQRRPVTEESALATLAASDIDKLIETADRFMSDADFLEDSIYDTFDRIRAEFSAAGLNMPNGTVRICDSFPKPYHGRTSWAMNYDISDHNKYGLDIGVFLKREHLMPLYTPTLIAHELTHTALGQVETKHLARGFEEGIAEFFGTLFVGGNIFHPSICEAVLINSRLRYPFVAQPWLAYPESMRQVSILILMHGWSAIVDLVQRGNREGRGVIKQAENDLLNQIWAPASRPASDRMTKFALEFLSFPQSMVVSPLALLLAERLHDGVDIDELLLSHQIDPMTGHRALQSLNERLRLIVTFDNKISTDETKPFLATNTIRYEIF